MAAGRKVRRTSAERNVGGTAGGGAAQGCIRSSLAGLLENYEVQRRLDSCLRSDTRVRIPEIRTWPKL